MKGIVFYLGNSVLDGEPIVGIATSKSENRKTGDMIQTWIVRRDMNPVEAVRTGADVSICGMCPHRTGETRICYVNLGQAPLSVYNSYKRGLYPRGSLQEFIEHHDGKPIRMGAYGDPVAIPWIAWTGLHLASKWTGYTHQWRRLDAAPFRNVLMASCDGPAEAAQAARAGWRTFLVRPVGQKDPVAGAIECPSNRGTQCKDCGLCSGQQKFQAPSIWIEAHGPTAKAFA